jgi:hypothetical protein
MHTFFHITPNGLFCLCYMFVFSTIFYFVKCTYIYFRKSFNHLFGCLCQLGVIIFYVVSIMLNAISFFLCVCIVGVQFTYR